MAPIPTGPPGHSDIPNVLASRYAGSEIRRLWSPVGRVVMERELWVAVLEAQTELGVPVPDGVADDYRAVIHQVDLASIRSREEATRHDLAARIAEFCALAGHEHIHKGLTSRDVTENVEQLVIRRSLETLRDKTVAVLAALAGRAVEYRDMVMVGRSHNVAAQPTTVGKRLASAAEETLAAYGRLETLIAGYPLRGIKGPVGTQQDLLDLFGGDEEAVDRFEAKVADGLGFSRRLASVGQIYPRSLDLEVVSTLAQLAAGPSSLATTLRLMAGADLASGGFQPGQVGSSAMPHKTNMRTCERINGLAVVLGGFLAMASGLSGHQWNEGDVSDSVVRRVMLPDSFFAADGLLEATLHVVRDMAVFPDGWRRSWPPSCRSSPRPGSCWLRSRRGWAASRPTGSSSPMPGGRRTLGGLATTTTCGHRSATIRHSPWTRGRSGRRPPPPAWREGQARRWTPLPER